MIPELVKKKEERNATLKKKTEEARLKKKEERKTKLKEYHTRGEKWYKADVQEKKELIETKRQVRFFSRF